MKKIYYGLIFGVCLIWKSKLLKRMKIVVLLILITITQTFALDSYAQNKRLSLNFKNEKIITILDNIEDQSEFYFMFDASKIDVNQKKSIDCENRTINSILDQLFENTGITYRISDRQIGLINTKFADAEQGLTVSGKVTDSSGSPLPGVTVIVKGTTNGTVTNTDGEYSLSNVPGDAILQFSFVGMRTQGIAVAGKTFINLTMVEEAIGIEEVVAIGYGTMKKSDLTGAVSNIKADKLEQIPAVNLSNTLAGRLAGVYVERNTGIPGTTSDIRVRSQVSWNDSPALYVIDGVISRKGSFDMLDPSEIEDITVLKDAAATSIYGSRAAGGVILISTKRGEIGKPVITYNGSFSLDIPFGMPELMDVYTEQIPYTNSVFSDPDDPTWGWVYWTDEDIQGLKDMGGPKSQLDYIYRTPTIQRHTLDVSGGSEVVKYFIGGSYVDDKGFIDQVNYDKYSIRCNVEAKISNNLTAFLQVSTNYDKRTLYTSDIDGIGTNRDLSYSWWYLYGGAYYHYPAYVHGDETKPVDTGFKTNLVEAVRTGYENIYGEQLHVMSSLAYDVPFVKGLSLQIMLSKNSINTYTKEYDYKHTMYTLAYIEGSQYRILDEDNIIGTTLSRSPSEEYLSNDWGRRRSYQLNGQINYIRDFGQHHLEAIAVYEQSESNFNYMSGIRKGFPVITTDQFWATDTNTENYVLVGGESETARLSYIGKINYNFADKYLLSASVRSDGSVLFAPNKRWGTFPAISLGWRISEEPFFKDNISFMDYLKPRVSFGVIGNDNVGGWQWQDQFYVDGTYVIGGEPVSGISTGGYTGGRYYNVANSELTWEKTKSYNFGVDTRFMNTLTFNAEYFMTHTTDILGGRLVSYPLESGINPADENYGILDTHGFEIELGYEGKIGNEFNYLIMGNFSYATNKVILADVAENAQPVDDPNGKTLGYLKGLKYTDMIRTQEDLDALPGDYTINGVKPFLGMLNYEDISGAEGVPDGKIDKYDRVVLSNYSSPPISCGLNFSAKWKSFSVDIFFQGHFGFDKFLDGESVRAANVWDRTLKFWVDSWSSENTDAKYPVTIGPMWSAQNSANAQLSSFWLRDASFIRLRQGAISYDLPDRIINKIGIEDIKLSLSGTNLFTWSKMKIYDPEMRVSNSYPLMRTITFGLKMTL